MGIGLLGGRDFDQHDTTSSPNVAIVNESFARRLGLGADPMGRRFRRQATPNLPETVYEIVGFVKDTKYYSLREEFTPIAFLAASQDREPDAFDRIVIRSSAGLASTTMGIRKAIEQVSPDIELNLRSFETTVRDGLLRERLMSTLSSFFGALAVLIASVGLYGVMSYLVVCRRSEIGLRMALGANGRKIVGLVLTQAAWLLMPGIAIGSLLALAVAGTVRSMLYGFEPHDPRTLIFAAVLLGGVTLAASYLPARRAARLEPMGALREE
jgi:ABC-type antimicrobial peptide transport system permease subunit